MRTHFKTGAHAVLAAKAPQTWHEAEPGIWVAGSGLTAASDGPVSADLTHDLSVDEVCERLSAAPGALGCVITNERYTVATPGRFRSWPLYYRMSDGEVTLADHPAHLLRPGEAVALDPTSRAEFLHAGYCTGSHTLCEGVQQVLPGQALIVHAHSGRVETRRLFVYPHAEATIGHEGEAIKRLHDAYHAVLDDVVRTAGDRLLVLPLTGGYDSRLLALLLAERGVRNVHCVTYDLGGRSWEVETGREIAKHLGFAWSEVPLTGPMLRRWYYAPDFVRFQVWASGWSHMPHRYEWPTAQYVQDSLGGGEAAYVVSAICAGSVAGAFAQEPTPENRSRRLEDWAEVAVVKFYHYLGGLEGNERATVVRRVHSEMDGLVEHVSDVSEVLAAWEWQERESKYIASATRVHDWHGIPWAAPFLDARVADLWGRIVPGLRSKKSLHRTMVEGARAGMPSANEPEYRRSNVRIIRRIIKNAFCFKTDDFAAMWRYADGNPQRAAKLLHGEASHARIALRRIRASIQLHTRDGKVALSEPLKHAVGMK